MASSVAQCDEMIATCASAGTRLAINHQMRFMDQYRLVNGFNTAPRGVFLTAGWQP